LVVIDAVEGVRTQTHTVLQQAYHDKVRCCLVINKVCGAAVCPLIQ